MRIVDYQLVETTRNVFEQTILEQIEKGWEPLGGAFLNGSLICQAMVKYKRLYMYDAKKLKEIYI